MSDFGFDDFGFTAVTEDELEVVQQAQSKVEALDQSAGDAQKRLDDLYNAILPLLKNLKANPDKPIIHWPNRVEKVEEFEQHIARIYRGE